MLVARKLLLKPISDDEEDPDMQVEEVPADILAAAAEGDEKATEAKDRVAARNAAAVDLKTSRRRLAGKQGAKPIKKAATK